MRHELKTDPVPFQAHIDGHKKCELRYNDRAYVVGDELLLRETRHTGADMERTQPLVYTGRDLIRRVTHVDRGFAYGLMPGWVALSLDAAQ